MNFKSILLAAAVGLSTLGVVPEAKAAECVTQPTFRICFEQVSRNGLYNTWDLSLNNRYTTEFMRVTCYGKSVDDWSSRGGANQQEAQYLANYFCSL
jgi:hypothetical protein